MTQSGQTALTPVHIKACRLDADDADECSALERSISTGSECSTQCPASPSMRRSLSSESLSTIVSAKSDTSDLDGDEALEVDTLIFFDWDDTLFPTSWCFQQSLFDATDGLSDAQAAQLQALAEKSWMTLETAMGLGKVVLVTNAEQGWVESTCAKFMPSLLSSLDGLTIVSARSSFQDFSDCPSEWKRLTFQQEVDRFYGIAESGSQMNILSIGDSRHELEALVSVTRDIPKCSGKSVKLLESPSIEQLIDQHDVLGSSLLEILEHNGDLDVEIGSDCF